MKGGYLPGINFTPQYGVTLFALSYFLIIIFPESLIVLQSDAY